VSVITMREHMFASGRTVRDGTAIKGGFYEHGS